MDEGTVVAVKQKVAGGEARDGWVDLEYLLSHQCCPCIVYLGHHAAAAHTALMI